jgi:hypothetical protein
MSLWQALAGQHVDESIQVSPGSDNVLKLSFPRVRHVKYGSMTKTKKAVGEVVELIELDELDELGRSR